MIYTHPHLEIHTEATPAYASIKALFSQMSIFTDTKYFSKCFKEKYNLTDLVANILVSRNIIEDNQIIRLIEFDGPQHNENNVSGYFKNTYEDLHKRDLEKNEWAKQ